MPNAPETNLSPEQSRALRRIAGIMIPASETYAVPGADDPAIIEDIIRSLGRDAGSVRDALGLLDAHSGGAFADLDQAQAATVAESFLAGGGAEVTALGRAVLQCYYRDDRVVRSLGLEPRPPFPKGHVLEQGDWSLLDAVRGRPKMWRDAP
ncbi:MAG: hypothetical protein WDN25_31255 [Acetobacteraceae bacterium]